MTGPTTFTLNDSTAQPTPVYPGWTRPAGPGFIPGHVVRVADVPHCTGTQTAEPPMTAVDGTACQPWSRYPAGGVRQY